MADDGQVMGIAQPMARPPQKRDAFSPLVMLCTASSTWRLPWLTISIHEKRNDERRSGDERPADGVGIGHVDEQIGDQPGCGAGGDGPGEEHREQERRLPEVAALALGEEEGGVARDGGAGERCGNGEHFEEGARISNGADEPQTRRRPRRP